jgi:hypothetical protein
LWVGRTEHKPECYTVGIHPAVPQVDPLHSSAGGSFH